MSESQPSRSFLPSRRMLAALNRSPDRLDWFAASAQLRRIRSPQADSPLTCVDMCSRWQNCFPPASGTTPQWESCFCQMAEWHDLNPLVCDPCTGNAGIPTNLVQEWQTRCIASASVAPATTTSQPPAQSSSAPTPTTTSTSTPVASADVSVSTTSATSAPPPSASSASQTAPQSSSSSGIAVGGPVAFTASPGGPNVAAIAGGITAGVLFLIAAIVFWFIRRRKQQGGQAAEESPVSIDHVPEVWPYPASNPGLPPPPPPPPFFHPNHSTDTLMQSEMTPRQLTVPTPSASLSPHPPNPNLGSLGPQDLERLAERVASLITTTSGGARSDTVSWISSTEPLTPGLPPPAYGELGIPQKRG